MKGYLFQIKAYDIEELYWSPENIPEEFLQTAWKEYSLNEEYDSFEEYWKDHSENIDLQRVFLTEIYI